MFSPFATCWGDGPEVAVALATNWARGEEMAARLKNPPKCYRLARLIGNDVRVRFEVEGVPVDQAGAVWRLLFNDLASKTEDLPPGVMACGSDELGTVIVVTMSTEEEQTPETVAATLDRVDGLVTETNQKQTDKDERLEVVRTAASSWWVERERERLRAEGDDHE